MLTATEGTFCPTCRCRLQDQGEELVCPKCVPGDTVIVGDNKPICNVNVDDMCIGASGGIPVTKKYVRHYAGPILKIKARGMLPLVVTPDHPILGVESIGATNYPVQFSEPRWIEAKNLVEKHSSSNGHYLLVPRLRGSLTISGLRLSEFTTRHGLLVVRGRGVPAEFQLNLASAWLIGLYVAEGSRGEKSIIFSLGAHEKGLQERVANIIRTLGYKPSITRDGSVTEIRAYSRLLGRAFPKWCGNHATDKRVPEFILFHRDKRLIEAFLEGYYAGDGCILTINRRKGRQTFRQASTVSKTLALQLQLLHARLGQFLGVYKLRDGGTETIQGRKVNTHEKFRVEQQTVFVRKERMNAKVQPMCIYVPVRRVETESYHGDVFNIETNDGTYLVSNAIVHNCGRAEGKTVLPIGRPTHRSRALDLTSSALGGFMGTAEVTYRERFSEGFLQSGSSYRYLKTISDFAGRTGQDYTCATLIERVCEKLSLPAFVPQNAMRVAQKLLENEEILQLKHKPTLPAISAFSMITACKITGQKSVTWRKVVKAFQDGGYRVKSSSIFRIGLCSPIKVRSTPPQDYLQTFLLQFRDNSVMRTRFPNAEYFAAISERANGLIQRVDATRGGHNPRALAAASIYAAEVVLAREGGRKKILTQKEAGEMAHMSEYTIREQYVELFRKLVV